MRMKPSGSTWSMKRRMNSWASRETVFFLPPIFAISITQGDLTVLDRKDAVVGQRHAVGIAAKVVEHGLWRAERLFGVDHPALLACGFDRVVGRRDFSFF